MKNFVICSAMALLFIVCQDSDERLKGPRVYITGGEQSIGSEIYVDGVKIGEMLERIYSGPESMVLEKGDKFAIGKQIINLEKDVKKEHQKYDYIRVPRGNHKFKFISKDGKILEKEIEIKSETYLGIDFHEMTIGGDDSP